MQAIDWDREYRYRSMFGLTHEQYLDEPVEAIEWLLRVDLVRKAHEQKQQEDAQRRAGG